MMPVHCPPFSVQRHTEKILNPTWFLLTVAHTDSHFQTHYLALDQHINLLCFHVCVDYLSSVFSGLCISEYFPAYGLKLNSDTPPLVPFLHFPDTFFSPLPILDN